MKVFRQTAQAAGVKALAEIIMNYVIKAPFVDKITKEAHRTIGAPYKPSSKERAKELEGKGFIGPAPADEAGGDEEKELADMTKKELVAYVEEKELDVDTEQNKGDLLAAIQEAEAGEGGSD